LASIVRPFHGGWPLSAHEDCPVWRLAPPRVGRSSWLAPRKKLAEAIPVSAGKLADWARRGWVHSRKTPAQRLWVLWADKQEVTRLCKLAAGSHRGICGISGRAHHSEGTTPLVMRAARSARVPHKDGRILLGHASILVDHRVRRE
jgi:hypothetical protein